MASSVTIDFNANLARFSSSIDKATNDLNKFQTNAQRMAGNVKSIFAGLGVGLGVAGLSNLVSQSINFADEMGKAAQKVGTTTEALSGLKYAADLSDVSFEQLQTGMAKLAKSADDAAGGSKSAAEAFAKLRIDPTQFDDTSDLFTEVAEQLSKLPDGAQKTALAMDLLGKSGAQLIPLLNGGADGLAEMRSEAERLGIVIDGKTAAAAEQFNDNMTRLSASLTGFMQQVGNALIPILADISDDFTEASGGAKSFGESVAYGVAFAADALNSVEPVFKQFGKSIAVLFKDVETAVKVGSLAGNPISAVINKDKIASILKERNSFVAAANEDLDAMLSGNNFSKYRDALGKPYEGAVRKQGTGSVATGSATGGAKAGKALDLDAFFMEDMQLAPKQLEEDQKSLEQAMRDVADAIKAQEQAWSDLNVLQQQSMDFELQGIEEASAAEQSHLESLQQRAKAIQELLDPQLKLLDTQAELNEMVEAGILSSDEAAAALEKMGEAADKSSDLAKDLGLTFTSAFEDAIVGGKEFSDVLSGLADDIQRILVRRTITEPLDDMISGMLNSADFGGVIGDLFGDIFGGFRASGGPVNYGKAYVVGEKGPELFMPNTSGTIVPNGAGGGGVVVNVMNNAPQTEVQATPRMNNGKMEVEIIVQQVIASDVRRNGPITQRLGEAFGMTRGVA